jgi:hypothetical protein
VLPSFLAIFIRPFPQLPKGSTSESIPYEQKLYYYSLPAIFNVGWAAV